MRGWKYFILLLGSFTGIALLFTFPLILNFKEFYAGGGEDGAAMIWNIWWMKYSLFELGQNPLVTNYLYYPEGANLTFYTMPKLLGMASIPLQTVLSLVVSYNVIYLLTAISTALATYMLVFYLLGERVPAFVAGILFAFSPIRFGQHSHLFMLATMLIPIFMLLVIMGKNAFYQGRKKGWLHFAASGVIIGLISYDTEHYTIFLFMLAFLYLLFILPSSLREKKFRQWGQTVSGLFLSIGTASVVFSPIIYMSYHVNATEGSFIKFESWQTAAYGADLLSFFIPYRDSAILGSSFDFITRQINQSAEVTFTSLTVLALSVFGVIVYRKRSIIWFWTLAAVVFALMSLGPFIHLMGRRSSLPGPYYLYSYIPVLSGMRTASRFAVITALALAILAAFGTSALIKVMKERRLGNRSTAIVSAAIIVFFFIEAWPSVHLTSLEIPGVYYEIADSDIEGAVLPIPLGWEAPNAGIAGRESTAMELFQTVHHRPILGGMVSRTAPEKVYRGVHTPVISYLSDPEQLDPSDLDKNPAIIAEVMARYDVAFIVVHKELPLAIYRGSEVVIPSGISQESLMEIDEYVIRYLNMEKIEETDVLVAYRRGGQVNHQEPTL